MTREAPCPFASGSKFEVVVFGAGPAGAACAILLALSGRRTLLVDAQCRPVSKAGEVLSSHTRPILRVLGLDDRLDASTALRSTGTVVEWGSPVASFRPAIMNLHGGDLLLDRRRFESLACTRAAEVGVTVWRPARPLSVHRHGSEWRILMQTRRGVSNVRGLFLIDATGRRRWLGRRLGARCSTWDSLVGQWALFAADEAEPRCLKIVSVSDGWWYSASVPGDGVVRCLITHAGGNRWSPATDCGRVAGLCGVVPLERRTVQCATTRLTPTVGPGWASIGDAAMTFDPLSAQGMMKALHDARALIQAADGQPLSGSALLRELGERHETEFAAYLAQRQGVYAIEQRWPETAFWRARHDPGACEATSWC